MSNKRKLAEFLKEVSGWQWDRFVEAEKDVKYTTTQSIVFSLIRACAMENLSAIKTALSRLDGKVATPIQIQMPKVYYLFPNAKEVLSEIVVEAENPALLGSQPGKDLVPFEEPEESPTQGFRDSMDKMAEESRLLPLAIIEAQERTEKHVREKGPMPPHVPKVQSVVVAHILKMAQERNLDAINEVFDQLDGKLVETIKVVGEDMYITQYSLVAPPGAEKNKDGVYQIEATTVQNMWRQRLDSNNKNTIILEG